MGDPPGYEEDWDDGAPSMLLLWMGDPPGDEEDWDDGAPLHVVAWMGDPKTQIRALAYQYFSVSFDFWANQIVSGEFQK